jgi:hypothetical protein
MMSKKILTFVAGDLGGTNKSAQQVAAVIDRLAPKAKTSSGQTAVVEKKSRKFPTLTDKQRALHGGITAKRESYSMDAAAIRAVASITPKK